MAPQTIVVTGASGFIGSWVVSALAAAAARSQVIGIGRRDAPPAAIAAPNVQYIACDLLRSEGWAGRLPGRVDGVIHLAGDGRTSVEPSAWTAQLEANAMLTARMADYAAAAKAPVFVLASSVYVYSGTARLPFVEEPIALPAEPLGASKLAAEALVNARAAAGAFHAMALRLFTVYGPRSQERQFIPEAIRKLRSSEPVARFRSPQRRRDFLYVEDAAAACLAALAARAAQPYQAVNIGSGAGTTIAEVVAILARLLGVRKPIEFTEDLQPPVGGGDHCADVTRSRAVLGWQPAVPLEEGLRRTVEPYLAVVNA